MSTVLSDFLSGKVPVWAFLIFGVAFLIKWWFDYKKSSIIQAQKSQALAELEVYKHGALKEIERQKSSDVKEQIVHKIQFEKEFQVYQDLWKSLSELVDSTTALRPSYEARTRSKPGFDIIQERVKDFGNAFEKVWFCIHRNKPFFAPEVFKSVLEVVALCRNELFATKILDPNADYEMYWDLAQKNQDKIVEYIDEACEAVRGRFWSVTVRD